MSKDDVLIMDDMDFGETDKIVGAPESVSQNNIDYSEFEAGIESVDRVDPMIKALIYGPQGTGKTTIGSTFPKPLFLDVNERGTKSIVGSGGQKRLIDSFDLFRMAYWYLESGKHPYETVVIDTMTLLQELALNYIMKKEQAWDTTKDLTMPNRRDWGGLSVLMKKWVLLFRNLPMNVVFLAQEKTIASDDDLESTAINIFPDVSRSVRSILGAAVDVIGYTYVANAVDPNDPNKSITKFCLSMRPNREHLAKVRVMKGADVPGRLVNPSYDKIKYVMEGEYHAKT